MDFYKKMCIVHNKWKNSPAAKIKEFPDKDEHLKYLQDRLREDELSIQKIKGITEEVVKYWIAQASINNYLLEYLYKVTPPKMTEKESHLVVHEVSVRLLEQVEYRNIAEEANAWGKFIEIPTGPT